MPEGQRGNLQKAVSWRLIGWLDRGRVFPYGVTHDASKPPGPVRGIETTGGG